AHDQPGVRQHGPARHPDPGDAVRRHHPPLPRRPLVPGVRRRARLPGGRQVARLRPLDPRRRRPRPVPCRSGGLTMLKESYWPADTSLPVLDLTPGDLLRDAADDVPDRTALVETAPPGATLTGADRTDRTWTYARLLQDAEHAAHWLAARFEPGE